MTLAIGLTAACAVGHEASAQWTQATDHRATELARAKEAFNQQRYALALHAFESWIDDADNIESNDFVDASYHAAMSALALYHKDAVVRVKGFMADFPKPAGPQAHWELANYHYKRKNFLEASEEFMGIRIRDLAKSNATSSASNWDTACSSAKHSRRPACTCTTSWTWRANFKPRPVYFSHIAYLNGQPQVASTVRTHRRPPCLCGAGPAVHRTLCTPQDNSTA